MSCCFHFNYFSLMDGSLPGISCGKQACNSSVMRQDLSRSVTLNVDGSPVNPLELAPSYSRFPDISSDQDIEDVLNKISELLNCSNPTTQNLNDSRSIEDILKEAEEIVKENSVFFEKSDVKKSPNSNERNDISDETECSEDLEAEKPCLGAETQTSPQEEGGVNVLSYLPTAEDFRPFLSSSVESSQAAVPLNLGHLTTNLMEGTSRAQDGPLVTSAEPKREPVNSEVSQLQSTETSLNVYTPGADKPVPEPTSATSTFLSEPLEKNPDVESALNLTLEHASMPAAEPVSRPAAEPLGHTSQLAESILKLAQSIEATPEPQVSKVTPSERLVSEASVTSELRPPSPLVDLLKPDAAPRLQDVPRSVKLSPSENLKLGTKQDILDRISSPNLRERSMTRSLDLQSKVRDTAVNRSLEPPVIGSFIPVSTKRGSLSPRNKSQSSPRVHSMPDREKLRKEYEEKIFDLERQIRILSAKLCEYESEKNNNRVRKEGSETEAHRMSLLEEELMSQEQLIAGYQRENQRILADTTAARRAWEEAETKLMERVKKLERELKRVNSLNTTEAHELREKLADARQELVNLEEQTILLKNEKRELQSRNAELDGEVRRLRGDAEAGWREAEAARRRDRERERRTAHDTALSTATLQARLSQANTDNAKKQTEVVRLTGEVSRLRGELERARLGSVVGSEQPASHHVRQLELALDQERNNATLAQQQRDAILRTNQDLTRQIKELEAIMKKRAKSGSGLPWATEAQRPDSADRRALEERARILESELSLRDKQLSELKSKYEKELSNLREKVKDGGRGGSAGGNAGGSAGGSTGGARRTPTPVQKHPSSPADTHLMATIRGLKTELAGKEKQLSKANKELEEARRKLMKPARPSQSHQTRPASTTSHNSVQTKTSDKASSVDESLDSATPSKNYNPFMFDEDRETLFFLKNENKLLREDVKKLEQDLITLHNKRIQDLSELEASHCAEVSRAVREQAARHSSSQLSYLKGQLYTQQMVISHLKNQIKMQEERMEEMNVVKAERDQLQESVLEANKKLATLHQLASPGSSEYSVLVEKLETLERRHEMREAKLQAIAKQLIARQRTTTLCNSATCRDKLYNKNREICYYRAEIDKILDTLAEYKYK